MSAVMFSVMAAEPTKEALLRIQGFEKQACVPAFHSALAFNELAGNQGLSFLQGRELLSLARAKWAAYVWWCRKGHAYQHFDPKCEIRPSTVHGQGVFATCLIGKGEVITIYPSDGFLWWASMQSPTCYGTGGDDVYKFDVSGWPKENGAVAIFGEPKKIDDPLYLGHMINDRWVCRGNT